VTLVDSFCRDCGGKVRDFHAPDEAWRAVAGGVGGVLCYDCFCEHCDHAGVPSTWRLVPIEVDDGA
jgi:hypothetical protein